MTLSNEPDYVVLRAAPSLPGGLPPHQDGQWIDRSQLPEGPPPGWKPPEDMVYAEATAVPTGRFEVRDDGAVAEVYEVHPGRCD